MKGIWKENPAKSTLEQIKLQNPKLSKKSAMKNGVSSCFCDKSQIEADDDFCK